MGAHQLALPALRIVAAFSYREVGSRCLARGVAKPCGGLACDDCALADRAAENAVVGDRPKTFTLIGTGGDRAAASASVEAGTISARKSQSTQFTMSCLIV